MSISYLSSESVENTSIRLHGSAMEWIELHYLVGSHWERTSPKQTRLTHSGLKDSQVIKQIA